jgi:acyl carrier protein
MRFSEDEIASIISEKITGLTHKKNISADEKIIENGILNSISLLELAVELEKTFSVSFSFIEIDKINFSTPGSIQVLIQKKLNS